MSAALERPRRLGTLLVTGGAGFIGSHFIRRVLDRPDFEGSVVNFDALTYAGNPESLADVVAKHRSRYRFLKGDLVDREAVRKAFHEIQPDAVVHFAAESHVDRSIHGPEAFVKTNILGTFNLLEAAREQWKDRKDVLFHHVSTDEVFGSLGAGGFFTETTPYDPRSPYSASKAAADHLVRAAWHTFHLPFTLTNCSNNYGSHCFPEKMIPVMIENMLAGKPLPVYGEGKNVREWIHVEDHVDGIFTVMTKSQPGETWLLGSGEERSNLDLVHELCDLAGPRLGKTPADMRALITFVKDRPGHDHRYAIDASRVRKELGWAPKWTLKKGLEATFDWYRENRTWIERVKSGAYRDWMKQNYGERGHS